MTDTINEAAPISSEAWASASIKARLAALPADKRAAFKQYLHTRMYSAKPLVLRSNEQEPTS